MTSIQSAYSRTRLQASNIKIGPRFRKDLGDIQTLADSIDEIGLLHPIVVNENNELIAGARRLEACKSLGWNEISVTVVPVNDLIKGEFYENSARKDFSFSERIAILEEIEKRRIGHRVSNEKGANLAPFQKQERGKKSRDIVAKFTKTSPAQLQKEKKIMQKITENPEKYGDLKEKLNSGKMKINKAYRRIVREERIEEYMVKASPPDSIRINEHGDIEKIYSLKNGQTMLCTEPPPEKWSVLHVCSKLHSLEMNIKYYQRKYQETLQGLRRLENELNLCVLDPRNGWKW